MKELYIIASGVVQGVFFRRTVEEHALRYELKGYAKNLADGTVEIVVQGTQDQLDQFIESLEENPGKAKIENLKVKPREIKDKLEGFFIR